MRYAKSLNVLGIAVVATMVMSGATAYAQEAAQRSRIVWGAVNANGTVRSGTGFTVTHTGGGSYVISFSPPFLDTPAVVGSQNNYGALGQDPRDGVVFPFVNGGAASAQTGDSSGNRVDRSFAFIAVGE
jgi:hypothetical protein